MKISKSKLRMWPIILIFLLNAMFLFIMPITNIVLPINSYHNKILIVVITFVLVIMYALKNRFDYFSSWDLIIISFNLMVLLVFIIQWITKEDTLFNLVENMYFLFVSLLYFPIKHALKNNKKFFLRSLIYIGTAYAFVNLLIFLFVKSGTSYPYEVPLIQYVNSNLRLPQSADIVGFTFIITLYYLCTIKSNKYKFLSILLFLGIVLVFVSQVRMMLLSVIVSSVVMIYHFYSRKNKNIKLLLFYVSIFFSIVLLYLIYNGNLMLIESFLGQGQRYASALYRLIEIQHYSQYMFMNIIFGFGFTNQPHIITYALTDIGAFAFIFRYGLLGILWLIGGVGVIIQNKRFVQDKILYYGLISFFCCTFVSLSMFDPQRIVFISITFALIESAVNNLRKEDIKAH